jgi:hypothetical protein
MPTALDSPPDSDQVLVIGLVSLPSRTVYGLFQSLAYMVKLYIELNMADLIREIAANRKRQSVDLGPYNFDSPNFIYGTSAFTDNARDILTTQRTRVNSSAGEFITSHLAHIEAGCCDEEGGGDDGKDQSAPPPGTIVKTVMTTVDSEPMPEEDITDAFHDEASTKSLNCNPNS